MPTSVSHDRDEISDAIRPRPAYHFTARSGWTNDPHGIVHLDDRYHMFFQYHPFSTAWDPACHWGHAVSEDLVVWTELPIALAPSEEVGCWSGTCVVNNGVPTILYTSMRGMDFRTGTVAMALGSTDLLQWHRPIGSSLIAGPPSDLEPLAFRDPFVFRDGESWRLLLGTGSKSAGGAVLEYSSPDLHAWTYVGVFADASTASDAELWMGQVWECPQFINVGQSWALVVSVWADDVVHYVAYTTGEYVDGRFTGTKWRRFTHGPIEYATTTFEDRDGNTCAMSWLRESGNAAPPDSPWAGAMSHPYALEILEDQLTARLHPAVLQKMPGQSVIDADNAVAVPRTFAITAAGHLEGLAINFLAEGCVYSLRVSRDGLVLSGESTGVIVTVPVFRASESGRLTLSVDEDILEIAWSEGSGMGACRIRAVHALRLADRHPDLDVRLHSR